MPTRWRCPPESWCGYARAMRSGSGRPTRAQSSTARRAASARVHATVQPHRLGDLPTDPHHRVQRGPRVLEHHRDALAAQRGVRLVVTTDEVDAVEADAPRDRRRVGRQTDDRQRRHRLARPGLADHAEPAALDDVERHAVDDGASADLTVRSSTESSVIVPPLAHRHDGRVVDLVDDARQHRRHRRRAAAQPRVDGVAHPVAEQVEAERRQDDGQAREHERAGMDRDRLLQLVQHPSPRRRRRRRQAEVAERGLGQHREGGDQRQLHDHGRGDVRQDVPPHRPPRRRPARRRRDHVVLRQHARDLGPHDARQHDARADAERQRHRPHRAVEGGDEHEGEDQRRQGDRGRR